MLVTALLLAGCREDPARTLVPALSADSGRVVEGSLHGRTGAHLTLGSAASRVDVQTADLPGLLYRITTPGDSGLKPRVTGAPGQVRVALLPTGDDGPDDVTIVLNQAVRWDIRLPAGAGEQHLDLAHGRITRLDLGGAGLVTASLPHPQGTVPVTFTDGTGAVRIVTPRHVPVRVRFRRSAGQISVPWTSASGPPADGILAPLGWSSTANRYTIDARADIGTLTLR